MAWLLAGPAVAASSNEVGPTLTMPDGSILTLPPGTHAFGPSGPAVPPPAAAQAPPPERPATPEVSVSERRKREVDELYERLAQAKDPIEAQAIGNAITLLFLHSGSDTADLLMSRAIAAMEAKDFDTATAVLDKLIVLRPHWAEAWNKRATVRYLADDDVGSMADIGQVLLIEPRHIGALSGMGLILHRNGNDRGALAVLRKAQGIDPQDAQVKTLIENLGPDVEGREL